LSSRNPSKSAPADDDFSHIWLYVLGFMFSSDYRFVALIKKDHPAWQADLLNGIGGKIEPGEEPIDAMVREFREETGYATTPPQWKHYAAMSGENDGGEGDFIVHCFATIGDLGGVHTMDEREPVVARPVRGIIASAYRMIDNLPWLILLAMDHLKDGRPRFSMIDYSREA
jgi:8-oxo-dGTP pyrophosphatase MutT (NUDIX family)